MLSQNTKTKGQDVGNVDLYESLDNICKY